MPYFCNEYMYVSWRHSVGIVITSGESEEVIIEAMTFLKTVKGIYFNVYRQETKNTPLLRGRGIGLQTKVNAR